MHTGTAASVDTKPSALSKRRYQKGSLHFNQAPMHEGVSPHLLTYIERVYFPNLTRTKLNTPTELNRGEFHLDPVTSTKRPKARAKEETYAYSIDEELIMLDAFKDDRRSLAAISLVSWSGVSRSELEGLRWEDRWEGHLHIARSVVEGDLKETKTVHRKDEVPIIPELESVLAGYHDSVGSPAEG